MSDLFGNHIVGFPMRRLKCNISDLGTDQVRYSHRGWLEAGNEPPRGKTNNVVSEQARHKPVCAVTEKS